jgi:hypothetical protein
MSCERRKKSANRLRRKGNFRHEKKGKIKNMASASFDSTKKATTTRFRILVHVKKHITIHKQPRKKRNKVFAFLFLPAGVSNIREKHHHSGERGEDELKPSGHPMQKTYFLRNKEREVKMYQHKLNLKLSLNSFYRNGFRRIAVGVVT